MSKRVWLRAMVVLGLVVVLAAAATAVVAAPPPGGIGDPTPMFGPGALRACPEDRYPRANKRRIEGSKDIAGVQLNGKWICFPDVQPGIVNDRVLVPARFVSEALSAKVDWDDNARKATVSKPGKIVELYIGRADVLVNTVKLTLDVAPAIHFDRTLVPLRFVSEALGAKVDWDASNYLVLVTTGT